ncbi:T9SS type A sorting domain-containing protein [Aurantibacillus circumpalustris]|uniref:T9SS type A sorting domain-containing protein n=1 Tax=Aurantibacillus circumpalustris TaxID=3036359 RepID=UPI00295B7E9A|nr:T9SS type A sorting domain-containing protein [Aurantibacillus circumpalustris]
MKKSILYLFAFTVFIDLVGAQVPKKVIVEHFTNTKCSICASRNPGFYSNLNNQNGVIHLAIHPSSPYPACVLSQHNVSENDARTNYYGVYGGTPRLVIQGVVIASTADYGSASIFTPYLSQNTPASIRITQTKFANDSIHSRIVVKTEALHNLGALKLFVCLTEDTVFYTGSNGESKHYGVFRKSYTGTSGMSVTLPAIVGDSAVYTMSSPSNSAWNLARINTLAILQNETTKEVIQSETTIPPSSGVPAGIEDQSENSSSVSVFYSNQNTSIFIQQNLKETHLNFDLYNLMGRKILSENIESSFEKVNANKLSSGIYLYKIESTNGNLKTGKLFVQ